MTISERILRTVPQYTRNKRHIQSLLHHGNLRKWANVFHAEIERKLRRIEVRSYPYLLIVDPCNFCNLRCPLCPTGVQELGRRQTMLSLEDFKRYFDPFAPYLLEVYLHSWGESLLNREVYGMIEYAQSRNVGTNLSTNLLTTDSNDLERLVDCGLEYLVVSLDGTSKETYAQYRVGGDYARVVENMCELIRRRNARGKSTPVVEWQFIVMRQNEHQIPEAERLAEELGVDLLRFIPVGIPIEFEDRQTLVDRWFPSTFRQPMSGDVLEPVPGRIRKPGPCFYLYRSVVINPDGGVSPCCEAYRKERDFADVSASEINVKDLWNNEYYRAGRALFADGSVRDGPPTLCDTCSVFERPSRKKSKQRKP